MIEDLRWAYGYARVFVPCYAVAGTVIYLLATGKGETPGYSLLMLLVFYAVAGAVTGTIVGLMRPIATRSLRGAMFVGWLAALPVYFGGAAACLGFRALADLAGDVGVLVGASIVGIACGRLSYKRYG